jgi:hypothetical protein
VHQNEQGSSRSLALGSGPLHDIGIDFHVSIVPVRAESTRVRAYDNRLRADDSRLRADDSRLRSDDNRLRVAKSNS